MKSIRFRVIILVLWLISLYGIDRLLYPFALSNLAIGLVFVTTVFVLVVSRTMKIPAWVVLLVPVVALFTVKSWMREFPGGSSTLTTLIEVSSVEFTAIMVFWVSLAMSEYEQSVAQIALGLRKKTAEPVPLGHGSIYREVRRARNHQRPLALISVGVDEKSIELNNEKIVQEIQASVLKQYKLQMLSRMLCDELEDCAVIVQDADHFLVVLPETLPEELPVVMERLHRKACDQVGVEIRIGSATLPHDGFTFEGLVDKAAREMESEKEPQPFIVVDQYPAGRQIN